jgi:hypothetical protein
VPYHRAAMHVYASVLSMLVLSACGTSTATTPVSDTPTSASAAPMVAEASAGLDAEIVETAITAPKLDKMKVRVDATGALVKQSLYHYDATAVPKAIRDLAAQQYPESTPVRYETEWYDDLGRVYEVEVQTKEGKRCEVAATPDGKLQYTECQLDPSELPSDVVATVHAIGGSATVLEAEHKQRDGSEEYTVELELPSGELYLRIGPDGALLGKYRRVPGIIEVPVP